MRVSIIGAGHVGLVTGACLAAKGHQAICVDVDQKKVDRIQGGESPFSERGLTPLVKKNIGGRLRATTMGCPAVGYFFALSPARSKRVVNQSAHAFTSLL